MKLERVEIACFTDAGEALAQKLWQGLAKRTPDTRDAVVRVRPAGENLTRWTARCFAAAGALVFVGAAGIAVRAIAPHIKGKTTDPAVLVIDEKGRFVVPLLSGHIGGANTLALWAAEVLGAQAVITTATDVNDLFAIDTWADSRGLGIMNPERIKDVSAKLLRGEKVLAYWEFAVRGKLPVGFVFTDEPAPADVYIGTGTAEMAPAALRLVPPALVLGVGCRRGTPLEAIEDAVNSLLAENKIDAQAIDKLCSIDLKRDEPGLVAYCQKYGRKLQTFAAKELAAVPGEFTPSDFVQKTTGVDNVCERAAVLGSGGVLIVAKTAKNGVTLAVGRMEYIIDFTET